MEILIAAIATAFNLIVIMAKANHNRESEAFLDAALFALIIYITAGSQGGMIIGVISSAIISTYLFFSPPKFLDSENTNT